MSVGRRSRVAILCAVGLVTIVCLNVNVQATPPDDAEPKHTIKEVMQTMKKGLLKKVASGNASAEEKMQLLDLYISLLENTPKKGDINSWHQKAGDAAKAAAKVVVGREGALKELQAATNCKACHDVRK